MTNQDSSPETQNAETSRGEETPGRHGRHHGGHRHEKRKGRFGRRLALAGGAVALLAIGGGVGAATVSHMRHQVQMAPLAPVAITAMPNESIVTVKGKVAEVFGNKFVLADDTGRALIETGRAGEGGKLVKPDEQITVQGRFDDGFVRAAFLIRADGKTEAIGGFGPHGPRWGGPHGWKHGPEFGPDRGPEAPRSDAPPKEPARL